MKKSFVLGVLAAVVLNFTGCESQEEKAARLVKIDDLQSRIQAAEDSIKVDKYNLELAKKIEIASKQSQSVEIKMYEESIERAEQSIQKNKLKLKELQK